MKLRFLMSYCRSSSARGKVIGKKRIFRDTSSTDRMPSTSKGESDPKYGVGFFFLSCCLACEVLVPWPVIQPCPRHWKWRVLTTGPPRKSECAMWMLIYGDNRGWDDWNASLTQQTRVWASSGRWWRTGKPGVLQFMGLQRARHNWETGQQHTTGRVQQSSRSTGSRISHHLGPNQL